MTNNTPKMTPAAAPVTRITLTQLIMALGSLGIDVESPAEQLEREEREAVAASPQVASPQVAADGADAYGETSVVAEPSVAGQTVADDASGGPRVPVFSTGTIKSPWSNAGLAAPATTVASGGDTVGIVASAPTAAAAILPAIGSAGSTTTSNAAALAASILAIAPMATSLNVNPEAAANTPTALAISTTTGAASCSTGPSSPAPLVNGFVCAVCHSYNLLKSAAETWYAVVAGRSVGVYQGWHAVQSLVSGVPHASYKKYPSEDAARRAFQEAMDQGIVVVIN